MMGKEKGVVSRFKKAIPYLVNSHCAAHKLALASSKAANDVPYLVKYQEIVNSIYQYFKQSPKHQLQATITQNLLSEKNLKYKQVFGTRWLSFHNSVSAILKTFDSLITTLESDANVIKVVKAAGLVKLIAKFQFVATSHFLMDVLAILNRTCLTLQSTNLVYSDVIDQIEITKKSLQDLQSRDGTYYREFLANMSTSPEELVIEQTKEMIFKGHVMPFSEKQFQAVKQTKEKFIDNLLTNLSTRFDNDDKVLSAFRVLNPALMPQDLNNDESDDSVYGIPDIYIYCFI